MNMRKNEKQLIENICRIKDIKYTKEIKKYVYIEEVKCPKCKKNDKVTSPDATYSPSEFYCTRCEKYFKGED